MPLLPASSSPPWNSFFPTSNSSLFSLQKWAGLQESTTKQDKTRNNKTRQKPTYQGCTRRPNRKKESQEQAKWVRDTFTPTIRSSQKHQAIAYMQRISCRPMQASYFFLESLWDHVSPAQLIQWVMFYWYSLPPLMPIIFPPVFCGVFQLWGEGHDRDLEFRLPIYVIFDYGSLYPPPSDIEGSLSDNNLTRH